MYSICAKVTIHKWKKCDILRQNGAGLTTPQARPKKDKSDDNLQPSNITTFFLSGRKLPPVKRKCFCPPAAEERGRFVL